MYVLEIEIVCLKVFYGIGEGVFVVMFKKFEIGVVFVLSLFCCKICYVFEIDNVCCVVVKIKSGCCFGVVSVFLFSFGW